MDGDRKALSFVILFLATILAFIIVGQWIISISLTQAIPFESLYIKLAPRATLLRLMYVLLVGLSAYLAPVRIKNKKSEYDKLFYNITMILLGGLIVLGFSEALVYNQIFYPIIFIAYIPIAVKAISLLRTTNLKNDDSIFGVSKEESSFYFEFGTDEGMLRIHKPQQNIYIDGGPGSGKSESFIKGMIYQCAERNYAGLIYDWEGDPTKSSSPILTKIAYGSIMDQRLRGVCKLNFAFINFTDMLRTVRVNVFSEKYVPKGSESLFIRNIAITLMKNLEPAWKEKTDFWANNAINYVYSVAYKCYKERDKGINTLPHVISICLSDSDAVFRWLSEDDEIALNMSSMLTAWKLGAQQQTAGAVSSAQTPLTMLNNKYIFWVLSPSAEEEYSLDITDKDHPTLLCIGNAPTIKEAVSPPISCIASVVMSQMNNPGKQESVFMVDEFPTVNLQGIDVFIGTARKHNVSTILAVQDFNQAVRDYGEKSANILKASCGNQAYGMTGNDKTARDVEALFGELKEVQESISVQDSGGGSRSESMQKEKVLKARDIVGQKAGHFVGKIANGKPPFFNMQFDLATYKEQDIPLFAKTINTGDVNMDREIMEEIVRKNYTRIIGDVKNILEKYQEK